mgnify:CR=1 FL=1
MGGVITVHYHCCIRDSQLLNDDSDEESVEKKALAVGEHVVDDVESFATKAVGALTTRNLQRHAAASAS